MQCDGCGGLLTIEEVRRNPRTYIRWVEGADGVVREAGRYVKTYCLVCVDKELADGAQEQSR